jgi:methylated-DNA-[protein]-cysteine S-methyltransferase
MGGRKMRYTCFETPVGELTVIGDEAGIQTIYIETALNKRKLKMQKEWIRDDYFFESVHQQLEAYFSGTLRQFEVTLNPQGTPFQKRVWQALQEIPYGETRTYGEIAAIIGSPTASRAVGAANGKNPIPIIIPCHRVIGQNGKLTGFAFGLEMKSALLGLEQQG